MTTEADTVHKRDQWTGKLDFLLSCIGFAVGLGNVWRFPYLCYKNGGGAFLVPYFISLVCGGVPVFFLEVALGQYMSQGGVGCWNISPAFKGIGISSTIIVAFLNIYYIVVLAWDVAYAAWTFNKVLPWSHCNNEWNTDRCRVTTAMSSTNVTAMSSYNVTTLNDTTHLGYNTVGFAVNNTSNFTTVDPAVEFWERRLLQMSDGVDQPNGIVWELAVALLFVWVLCYFCIWKGVKWTGKVVYFTATFPYIILTILLIRGVTLDGAYEGIVFYLKPDFSKLGDSQVWIDAGTQVFFSYAIALGAMTALGSYNKFKNNCYRDCVILCCINSCTSMYAGFAIFSVLGFMAKEQGVSIDQVAESGPGLAFIAYPKAVTLMPLSHLWAIMFFLMILLLGLDSQFVGMEAVITVFMDSFPQLHKGWRREIFIAMYCVVSYLIGLSMVTRGGMYVFQMFDTFSASGMALLWVCCFEGIAIGWVYGADRFYDNIEMMIGFRIFPWLKICWQYLTPILTTFIFVFMWVQYTPLTYNRTYVFPAWAQAVGLCIAFSSMICIPIYLVYKFAVTPGTFRERLNYLRTPILIETRIPTHWPDHMKLVKFSRSHNKRFHADEVCENEQEMLPQEKPDV